MLPGIWISVNSNSMSERASRIARASSALTASSGVNPASSTMSTARMRSIISSSTTRTAGAAKAMFARRFHLELMDSPRQVLTYGYERSQPMQHLSPPAELLPIYVVKIPAIWSRSRKYYHIPPQFQLRHRFADLMPAQDLRSTEPIRRNEPAR